MKKLSKLNRKSLLTILFMIATFMLSIFSTQVVYAQEKTINIDTSKEYIIYTKVCEWKCIQIGDFNGGNGTVVNLWDYWQQQAQRWRFIDAGSGYYYIVNAKNGKVMDIEGYSTKNGAKAIIWDNKYGKNQQFKFIDAGNGYYKIENRNSGLVLDLSGGNIDNGTQIIQYKENGGDNQIWKVAPVGGGTGDFKTAKDIVADMGVGWNLGNSLDSKASWISNGSPSDYETAWGNPVTTKAMIDTIKKAGFNTVRIPVSWGEHMGSYPNYTVDTAWMNRVEEVVNYVLDNGMYAIINVHHDGDWCVPTYANEANVKSKLEKLWTQIANRFETYGDHLIFEALNEPRLEGTEYEWNGGTSESRDVVNRLNDFAVKTIRGTGGNNLKRLIMVPTYAASGMSTTINDMVVPNDKNIIVSLHAYSPYNFAMNASGTDYWGSYSDKQALDSEFDSYYNRFVANGIPVVIGEFGSINKNNTVVRAELAGYFVSAAKKRGMACVWWDNNSAEAWKGENFGIFNRNSLNWYFPEVVNSMINNYNSTK